LRRALFKEGRDAFLDVARHGHAREVNCFDRKFLVDRDIEPARDAAEARAPLERDDLAVTPDRVSAVDRLAPPRSPPYASSTANPITTSVQFATML